MPYKINSGSFVWMIEKPIFVDLINTPSLKDPDHDFWYRLIHAPYHIMEALVYPIHIHAMKNERTDALYGKYSVLNTERELTKAGLGSSPS